MADTATSKRAGLGDNKRLVRLLVVGAVILVGLIAFKLFAGGGSSPSTSSAPVTTPAAGAAAPAAAASAAAKGANTAAKAAGPAPNTTRDPFHPLR